MLQVKENSKTKEYAKLEKLPVYKLDGSKSNEQVELNPELFGLERNDHVLYLAVKAEQKNRRQGTASSKTRSYVSGGGRKPWRQKGRGAARAGTTRSPIWTGGGITFGPQPIDHQMKVPAKVRRLARKVALSVKAQAEAILVLEDFDMDAPRTATIANMLNKINEGQLSSLILTDGNKPNVVKSCRNIPRVDIRDCSSASTFELLKAKRLFICRSAIDRLTGELVEGKSSSGVAGGKEKADE